MKTIWQRILIFALMFPAVLVVLPLAADEGSSWYIGFGAGAPRAGAFFPLSGNMRLGIHAE